MTRQEYESAPSINFSLLKKFAISPAYYKWYIAQPKSEPTPELKIGLATHTLSLQPRNFSEEYAVCPKVDRRTNDGKRVWAEFQESNAGKTILTEEEYATAKACSEAFRNSKIRKTIDESQTVFWETPVFSVLDVGGDKIAIKGIPDIYIEDTGTIFDLKTLGDVPTPKNMSKAMNRSDYYGQAAYYKILLEAWGKPVNQIIFGFVEKNAPNSFALGSPTDYNLNNAIDRVKNLLYSYNQCKTLDIWPSTDNGTVNLI